MTQTELRNIQDEICFDAPSMATCLGIHVRQYRNYLYGVQAIPEKVERNILELLQINRTFTQEAPARIQARIDKEFPHGIISDCTEAW